MSELNSGSQRSLAASLAKLPLSPGFFRPAFGKFAATPVHRSAPVIKDALPASRYLQWVQRMTFKKLINACRTSLAHQWTQLLEQLNRRSSHPKNPAPVWFGAQAVLLVGTLNAASRDQVLESLQNILIGGSHTEAQPVEALLGSLYPEESFSLQEASHPCQFLTCHEHHTTPDKRRNCAAPTARLDKARTAGACSHD